jgi:hypothetical protein
MAAARSCTPTAAERMFRHGWSVQIERGMLAAKLPAAAKELRTAIRLAAQDESALGKTGLAIRLSEEDEAPVFAHVLPLRRAARWLGGGRGRVHRRGAG